MRRYTAYYLIWLGGVLSFAAVAWLYYKRIESMGTDAVVHELRHTPEEPDGVSS